MTIPAPYRPSPRSNCPDGSSYSFGYELHFGELSSVTSPTGGRYQVWLANVFRFIPECQPVGGLAYGGIRPCDYFYAKHDNAMQCSGKGCQEKMTIHRPSGDETVLKPHLEQRCLEYEHPEVFRHCRGWDASQHYGHGLQLLEYSRHRVHWSSVHYGISCYHDSARHQSKALRCLHLFRQLSRPDRFEEAL